MTRISQITREQVAEQHRGAFDEVASPPGGIGSGPTSILKNSPELAKRDSRYFLPSRRGIRVAIQQHNWRTVHPHNAEGSHLLHGGTCSRLVCSDH